jgi:hypothetical protein
VQVRALTDARDSRFELVRIIAMLLIIGNHLSTHGIMRVLSDDRYRVWMTGSVVNKIFSSFLTVGGKLGVALFFILTGYFLINSKKINLKKLFCTTIFYSFFCFILFVVTGHHLGGSSKILTIIKSFLLPLSGGTWWFITSYTLLILIHPLINDFMNKLSKRQSLVFLAVFCIFWYALALVFKAPFFYLQRAVFFYSVGAFLYRFNVLNNKRLGMKALITVVLTVIYTCVAYFSVTFLATHRGTTAYRIVAVISDFINAGLLIPVLTVLIMMLICGLEIKTNRSINFVASTIFGIYLLHDSSIIRPVLWNEIVKADTVLYKMPAFPIVCLIVILTIFICGLLIDALRQYFFEKRIFAVYDYMVKKIKGSEADAAGQQ